MDGLSEDEHLDWKRSKVEDKDELYITRISSGPKGPIITNDTVIPDLKTQDQPAVAPQTCRTGSIQ